MLHPGHDIERDGVTVSFTRGKGKHESEMLWLNKFSPFDCHLSVTGKQLDHVDFIYIKSQVIGRSITR